MIFIWQPKTRLGLSELPFKEMNADALALLISFTLLSR
jgi:hypothetical protein